MLENTPFLCKKESLKEYGKNTLKKDRYQLK